MRGCDNMCSFCVVPFTRGRERSRPSDSIIKEANDLYNQGYKEVTLLGQNVDSYKEIDEQGNVICNFAQLLEKVALLRKDLRIRFVSSHPKDITDEVILTMKKYENICNHIHLPVQSGNSRVLELMNRTYTREWYIERIDTIKKLIPDCAVSTDIIIGFCSESETEHQDTLTLMDHAQFDFAYMYTYSERPGTLAAKRFEDDIPEAVKTRRFNEVLKKQQECSLNRLQQHIGKTHKVLIDGYSKKSDQDFSGKSEHNITVVFPVNDTKKAGDYVDVNIERCTPATLIGRIKADVKI
jgi:tRNA-2-methylthio-N6-dimethylallyladenosine synthase